jgi:hypothetical protein
MTSKSSSKPGSRAFAAFWNDYRLELGPTSVGAIIAAEEGSQDEPVSPFDPVGLVMTVPAWHFALMPITDIQTCEAKIENVWRSISVAEAKGVYVMSPKRCPSCHGAVVLSGSYAESGRRRFTHRKAHTGCPLDPKRYSGTPLRHPQALA